MWVCPAPRREGLAGERFDFDDWVARGMVARAVVILTRIYILYPMGYVCQAHHRPTPPSEHHLQLGNEARVVVKACKAKTARDVADAIDVAATKGDHAL